MMSSIAPSVSDSGFSLETTHEGDRLLARFGGNADMNAVGAVAEAVKALHAEAVRLAVREVACDFGSLQFMNSSCFKSFVQWVTSVEALLPEARYKIHLRGNRDLHWQKRSLDALRCLSEEIVTVERPV